MNRYIMLFLLAVLVSCAKDQDDSVDSNSLLVNAEESCAEKNLTIIKEKIESYISDDSIIKDYLFVFKANYQGNTVFVFGNCCPFCNTLPPEVLDCSGKFLGYIDYANSLEKEGIACEDVTDRIAVWPETQNCGIGN